AFSIDAEAHITEERMTEVLIGLHRVCPRVRFLGSYPRADNVVPLVLPGTSSQDFQEARQWVEALKTGEAT
ncbi:MAG TPA: prephenate dehydratase, partial [Actinomycetales bacterium]|nr:prephenate dehydratase [Actinomycetales bacterium]